MNTNTEARANVSLPGGEKSGAGARPYVSSTSSYLSSLPSLARLSKVRLNSAAYPSSTTLKPIKALTVSTWVFRSP